MLPAIALILLGLIAYANSFSAQFLFDDIPEIVENAIIKDPGGRIFSLDGYHAYPNRYIAYLTFALNYRLGLLDVTGYHMFNFCIHTVNALLLYAIVVISFRTPNLKGSSIAALSHPIAFAASALFITHPIQTESVTYIVQRLTSLSTTFYLLTVALYASWRLWRWNGISSCHWSVARYTMVLFAAIFAMKTKEITFTLPIAVCLYEYYFFGSIRKKEWIRIAPILATILIIPLAVLNIQKPLGDIISDVSTATRAGTSVSRADYFWTQCTVIAKYIRLLVLPVGQNIDHDHPVYQSPLDLAVLTSLAFLILLVAIAGYMFRMSARDSRRYPGDPAFRLISFGIIWFFVTLMVESSLIPIADVIFEHRVYLPSAGFFIAVSAGGTYLAHRVAPRHARRILVMTVLPIALTFAAATFQRNRVWADDLSLWTDAVVHSPLKSRPHNNLGLALLKRGEVDQSIAHFAAAVHANPNNIGAHNNLGVALYRKGLVDQAIVQFRIALNLSPDDWEAHNNLGIAYGKKGLTQKAAEEISLGMKLRSRSGR